MVHRISNRLVLFVCVVFAVTSYAAGQPNGPQRSGTSSTGQQRNGAQQYAPQQSRTPQYGPQQPNQQRRPVVAQARPAVPQAAAIQQGPEVPKWLPLAPDHEVFLNKILNYWEHSTAKVERYRCNFKRYEYDMAQRGPNNQPIVEFINKTYTEGKIQYAAPDKGLFKVDLIKHRTPPKTIGGQPVWEDQIGGAREHWVCDGDSIFEFNHAKKQLIVRPLPPNMKGKQIAEGPLPFMFGAKADQINRRFWVRVITPQNAKNEFHLEAIPKTRGDAQNFKKLHIIIDEVDFLPKAMIMFHRTSAKTTYLFENRETNWNLANLAALNIFRREFYEPKLPARDWKKVMAPLERTAAPPGPSANAAVRPARQPIRQAQGLRTGQTPR